VDRALVAFHPSWGEVTAGRQAIGLGRGVLFGALDLFAPFAPLAADREWRPGVDAFRAEYRLSPTISTELIAAFGESPDRSAYLARARGYLGSTDAEVIVGKRAEDTLLGMALSSVVGGAEIHGEMALFDTPGNSPDSGLFGNDDLFCQAVLGSSYTFDIGKGLTLLAEYHYSGFGVREAEDALARLSDPAFQKRFLRGDVQILGRHAMALRGSYPFAPDLRASALVLGSPNDGSGVFSPSLRWDWTEKTTITATGFLPWGPGPARGRLRSAYGGRPTSLFLQIATYF
jgi:hypothetical protein